MAFLYANENLPLGLVMALRDLSHDVLTTKDVGKNNCGLSDTEVLAFATSCGRIVVTLNRRDFIALHHAQRGQHAGIVVCTFDANHAALALRIDRALLPQERCVGALIRVHRPNLAP